MRPQYLFLYPIRPYFEFWTSRGEALCDFVPELMNRIDARYRQQGYDINWLMFGQNADPNVPHRTAVPTEIRIMPNDRVLSNGMTFGKHIVTKRYPNPAYILNQLPKHRRLVVGGFHQDDCVDKIARASHYQLVETLVDEDTTHLGIMKSILHPGTIPLVRERFTIRGFKGDLMNDAFSSECVLNARQGKPWFVQVVE